MIAPDVNILVSAFRDAAPDHARYRRWLLAATMSNEPLGLIDLVLAGFIRIVTNGRIFTPPAPVGAAIQFADKLRAAPNALVITPGDRHWQIFSSLCLEVGAKGNIVPAEASCLIDVRYAKDADGAPLDRGIREVCAREIVRGARIEIAGGLNRPPYPEKDEGIAALAERWIATAADLGVAMKAGPTGGGSDGNWTAAMGIPTLDGLGPVGGKYHTVGEYLVLKTLPERAAIAAIAIARLIADR